MLASVDLLILVLFGFLLLSAGVSLAPAMTTSRAYLQAERKLPGWLSGVAMASASLGSLETLGMGAAGAHYGVAGIGLFLLGSVPALLLAARVLVPVFYNAESAPGEPVRTLAEYLGLRFDPKTRALSAGLFVTMAWFVAGLSLYALARVLVTLRVLDGLAGRFNLSANATVLCAMALPAALVLVYVLLGGLAAAMYNQLLQFCLLMAGLLPVVFLGLKRVGGWSGLKAAVPAGDLHAWNGALWSGGHALGLGTAGLLLGVGIVLGGSLWCADFRLLQMPMVAKDAAAARRAPLVAAALRIVAPLVLVLPGLFALSLPTPRTTIAIHQENGTIVHDITVVPAAVEAGQGLVPAQADASGKPIQGADGKALLDYALAMPNVLLAFLPLGLLGLGLAALLASLMGGVAASLTAANTVVACDLYQAFIRKNASDKQMLSAGRWAALGGMTLTFAAACAALRVPSLLATALLAFALVNAPLFATLLLGVFWKRANGQGAFAGLLAGAAAALLCHGIALPAGARPGLCGGWIVVLVHPASGLALGVAAASVAFCVSLLVAAAVSLATAARPEAGLATLMHRPGPKASAPWKQPEAVTAVWILLAAILLFATFL